MITSYSLATLNALLNSAALLCVLLGVRAIRRRELQVHKRFMLAAFSISLIFLSSYITRMVLFGDTRFMGEGALRYAYFALLISHVLLAIIIAPGVLYTVWLGVRDERARHKRWAPKVLPVWIYVLVTGVLVYLVLHHWPLSTGAEGAAAPAASQRLAGR
jgi:putative membrane protein